MTTEEASPGPLAGDPELGFPAGRAPPGSPRFGLAWKIFLGSALVVASVLGAVLLVTSRSANRAASATVERGVTSARERVASQLEVRARALAEGAGVFAQNPGFRSLVAARRPEDALDQAREAVDRLGASWVQITDAAGVRLAKTDAPDAPPEILAGYALVAGALEGRTVTAYGTAGDSALFYAVALPVEGAAPGQVAGTLMATRVLDDSTAAVIAAATESDVIFYLLRDGRPHVAASTLARSAELEGALPALLASAAARDAAAPGGPPAAVNADEVELAGDHYVARAAALHAADGRAIGGFAVLRSREAELAAFADLQRTILVAGALGLLAALVVSLLIARQITRRLADLVTATRGVAVGDYSANVTVRGRDEIGVLAESFRAMLADLREKQVLVEFARLTPVRGQQRQTTPGTSPAFGNRASPTSYPVRRTPPAGVEGVQHAATAAAVEQITAPYRRVVWPPQGAPDVLAAASALRPGQRFAGRFEVHRMIGAGGSGVVFRATDRERDEVVALKVLRPDLVQADPAALERLEREVRIAHRLSHPNIVRVFETGEADGLHYLTMEFVEGSLLRDLIDQHGGLPVTATLTVAKQLCRALEHAHEHGVVHRDIKPQNLVITPRKIGAVLKVMDLGTARFSEAATGITEAGVLIGTPGYMAPEQLRGLSADPRSDIYATGVVLYECLTGGPPFPRDSSPLIVLTRVLDAPPPDPADIKPDIPRPLANLVLRTLAKDPADRPQSAAELYEALVSVS